MCKQLHKHLWALCHFLAQDVTHSIISGSLCHFCYMCHCTWTSAQRHFTSACTPQDTLHPVHYRVKYIGKLIYIYKVIEKSKINKRSSMYCMVIHLMLCLQCKPGLQRATLQSRREEEEKPQVNKQESFRPFFFSLWMHRLLQHT